jgi:ribosomal protein S18 acetylase RimI-like enzyme
VIFTVKQNISKEISSNALTTCVNAFHNDEFYKYIVSNNDIDDFLRKFFEFRLNIGRHYGEIDFTSEKCEGVAIWIPSDNVQITTLRMILSGGLNMMLSIKKDERKKIMDAMEFFQYIKKDVQMSKYWYLSPVAVDPLYQGKGFASFLIRKKLKEVDDRHMECLLETQGDENEAFYKRYGFKTIKAGKIPHTDIPHYVMKREA